MKKLLALGIGVTSLGACIPMSGPGTQPGVSPYDYFADDLPDASEIERVEQEFKTVKIYDRTGQHLLYESIDPRPFRGDRTYLPISQIPVMPRSSVVLGSPSLR